MKENFDDNPPPFRKREQERAEDFSGGEIRPSRTGQGAPSSNGHHSKNPFSFWMVIDLLAQRWHWLAVGSFFCAAVFYLLGWYVIKPKFTAEAQLFRQEPPAWSDFFKTPPPSADTLS